ncbi:hypothetical protein UFOVP239_26 [uncultured Caudovirales phage]|uniref:Uncharacterized protein n=1 Tax=uncultured Caudovirales phage TaxID=2100421 RepID=A0A6J7WT70_9CAUD|nr:hypothetical protein UFOVP239_26 [uncultured Caudovirales phage]
MTREDIIRMAKEAGYGLSLSDMHAPALERFAALVAAHEREACAKVAEDYKEDCYDGDSEWYAANTIFNEIKSRGEE